MIEPIGTGAIEAVSETTPANSLGDLGSDAFLKLLVAQLKYQNPMAPSDGASMLAQTAQFTTVETLKSIAEVNQQLMGFQKVTMALSVVGKSITAVSSDGGNVAGLVTGLRFTTDGPLLAVAGHEVPLEHVLTVSATGDAATN